MKKVFLLITLLSSIFVFSQQNEVLSSDRPGQALSTNIVGNKVFQVQPGVDFFSSGAFFVPNSYFRYGISDKVELNANFAYSTGGGFSEISGFDLGTRIAFNKNNDKVPSALQISVTAPIDNLEFGSQVVYTLGINLTNKIAFTGNLGVNFNNDFDATGLYIANFSYTISKNLGLFVESFRSAASNSNFAFDSGFYYLINNDFQLDLFAGDNNGFFLSLGATIRILPKK